MADGELTRRGASSTIETGTKGTSVCSAPFDADVNGLGGSCCVAATVAASTTATIAKATRAVVQRKSIARYILMELLAVVHLASDTMPLPPPFFALADTRHRREHYRQLQLQ